MVTDFAIIGGGIAGASIAYHLSERCDRSVTVFERERKLASGKTARSNAIFRMAGEPEIREMKRYGLALYNEMLANPRADHDVETFYERYDRLEVATTQTAETRLSDRAAEGAGRYLERDAISERVILPELRTSAVRGGLYYPDAIRFDPTVLAMEFVERARRNGVVFETDVAVTDVLLENGNVIGIETTAGRVESDVVISAAGAHNGRIAGMAGVDLPQRHDIGVFVDVKPKGTLGHTFPNVKHADTGVFYTGRADGTIVIGRSGSGYASNARRDPAEVPDAVPTEILETISETADLIVPALRNADVLNEWVGLACKTPDGRPILGQTDRDGFAVAAFHSEGIQLAPAAGRILVAQLVDDRPPSDFPAVAPSRFETCDDHDGQ